VLDAQVGHYPDLPKDTAGLSEFSYHQRCADLAGYIGYDAEGFEIFSFGKYRNHRVADVFKKDLGYFGWLQNADFPLYTKRVLTAIQLRGRF